MRYISKDNYYEYYEHNNIFLIKSAVEWYFGYKDDDKLGMMSEEESKYYTNLYNIFKRKDKLKTIRDV